MPPLETSESSLTQKQIEMLLFAGLLTITLFLITFVLYEFTKPRGGQVILPGGVTYLGPEKSPNQPVPTPTPPIRLSAPSDATWKILPLKNNPLTVSYPDTVTLALYPNAATETLVIRLGGSNPTEYMFLTMLDLNKGLFIPYKNKPKRELVEKFDTLTMGLSGIKNVRMFTNTNGLVGYRAHVEALNGTVTDEVFFEVPKNPSLMIRLTNSILDPTLYDRMIDSVRWDAK
jgi:hypothetical protein